MPGVARSKGLAKGMPRTFREFGIGAGKTTTIKLLITLTRPAAGTARVCGYGVQINPVQVQQSIGYASQEVIADELLTGRW